MAGSLLVGLLLFRIGAGVASLCGLALVLRSGDAAIRQHPSHPGRTC
jgi:hypothetical protein